MGGVAREDLRRGQLWWAWLDPAVGSEQAGRRPVVIVSGADLLVGPTVMVVPLTSSFPERLPAIYVRMGHADAQLSRESVALCHQVRAISTRRLVRRIGNVPETEMRAIDRALLYALGLEDAA